MPLTPGSSNDIVSANVSELMKGKVVGKTRRKYGKRRAQKQAVAIAMRQAGKTNRTAPLNGKRTPRKRSN
jgi:hypothetical protein